MPAIVSIIKLTAVMNYDEGSGGYTMFGVRYSGCSVLGCVMWMFVERIQAER